MHQVRLPIRTLWRTSEPPYEDDTTAEGLVRLVREALGRGAAPAVGVVVRPERIDLLPLKAVADAGIPLPGFLAALTASDTANANPAEAVGLMGTFTWRRAPGEPGVPIAMTFLEWPDCRWWQWRALLDPETRQIREETETRLRAVDGDAKPARLGGWWSLGRRRGTRIRMEPVTPDVVH